MSKLYTKEAAQCHAFSGSSISHINHGIFELRSNKSLIDTLYHQLTCFIDILMYHANGRICFTVEIDIKSLCNHLF